LHHSDHLSAKLGVVGVRRCTLLEERLSKRPPEQLCGPMSVLLLGGCFSAEKEQVMRILIANTPLMYRESLALAVHRHNPDFEVMIADPVTMDGEAERFGPHALVRDDDGIELNSPDGVVCWVGIMIDNHLHARISIDGMVSEIHEVSLYEMLAALDEVTKVVS